MKFCTLCDIGYLQKGLALYTSLMEHCAEPFTLFWLCLDDETYDNLETRNLTNIWLYKLSDFEKEYPELRRAKQNPATTWGTQWSQYCWCLNPWFTNFVLRNYAQDGEKIMSVDSDIFFYDDPKVIMDVVGDCSVGVHTHGFSGKFDDNCLTGWWNVGVIVFRRDEIGLQISEAWKKWLLNPRNEYAVEYGQCGDQRYIHLFFKLWDKDRICVFDEEWNRHHLAPWRTDNKENRPVLFFHFSHVTKTETGWKDNTHLEWNPSKDPYILPFYEHYYQILETFL